MRTINWQCVLRMSLMIVLWVPQDTITEGVGLNRLTANFSLAVVDDAIRVTDAQAVAMVSNLLVSSTVEMP